MAEPERPQMTIWRRVACWISKATYAQAHASARALTLSLSVTHKHKPKYVILIALPLQQWFRKSASLLRYTCIASVLELVAVSPSPNHETRGTQPTARI